MTLERIAILLMILASSLNLACGSRDKVEKIISTPFASPVPEVKMPADFKEFKIGPFRLLAPSDLKKVDIKGIDSEVHEYENDEFSIGMDISPMFYDKKYELKESSYEHAFGTMLIDGESVRFKKGDLNKPHPTAARNADGSTSPPVEKNHFITVFIPEAYAIVSVNYKAESSTDRAFAILQSLRIKRPDRQENKTPLGN